ncbi:MAG TPA: FAD-binding oxidoreductase [Chitinophagales bacterium]|nr:FAD-binding oxidoreductase [Chitinophagales bacterium]
MYNYIVVGQGIAGSMLSWFLMQQGQRILVIDKYNASSSSNIASGVIKPITGRRFVKTWMAEDLLPFSEKTYRQFELLFNDTFFHPALFVKLFNSIKEQNDWSVRCESPEYLPYLQNGSITYLDPLKVKNDFGGFEINGGHRLQPDKFLSHFRQYLLSNEALLNETFLFDKLETTSDGIKYDGYTAQKIIFCEGANAITNPYFKFLPFQLAKGECMYLDIQDFYTDRILNTEVILIPQLQVGRYYLGATHEWYFDDDKPTQKGENELLGNLTAHLKIPYTIVDHKAAIRPTVKDRRPFLGFHPEFSNVGIFNGMGTKGISLAPYFAQHFTQHLLHGNPIMKEVDIKRFL